MYTIEITPKPSTDLAKIKITYMPENHLMPKVLTYYGDTRLPSFIAHSLVGKLQYIDPFKVIDRVKVYDCGVNGFNYQFELMDTDEGLMVKVLPFDKGDAITIGTKEIVDAFTRRFYNILVEIYGVLKTEYEQILAEGSGGVEAQG